MSKKNVSPKGGKPTLTASAPEPAAVAIPISPCKQAIDDLNKVLTEECRRKRNQLKPCGPAAPAGCGCGAPTGGHEGHCKHAPHPELHPCITVTWGDSKCDCLETDDLERFCITICNCYDNVTFEGVTLVQIVITKADGTKPDVLPDGSPSVEAIPRGPICFGDIGPCSHGRPTCVSREFVLSTRGAKGGPYKLWLGPVCFKVTYQFAEKACFDLTLCADR